MKKIGMAVAFGMMLAGNTKASTIVCGDVSGVWSASSSPYIATCDLTVPAGQTLTIQPGVTLIMGQGLKLTVEGGISAIGSGAAPIIIRGANSSLYWDKIYVNYRDMESSFINCRISEATNALHLVIDGHVAGSASMNTSIRNCIFTNCQGVCIYGYSHGGAVWQASYNTILSPIVQNCLFGYSANGCVFDADGTDRRIGVYDFYGYGAVNPRIANCDFVAIVGKAIDFAVGDYAAASYPSVLNNVFAQCGIALQKNSTVLINDATGYSCFFSNSTNFVGYPPGLYGTICCVNPRGTPCDLVNNIFENPLFAETNKYTLATNSPCIDAGDPNAAYYDSYFPPAGYSQGTVINDIGLFGGPAAGQMSTNVFALTIARYVGVTINPPSAGHYRLEYSSALLGTNNWIQITNMDLTTTPFLYTEPVLFPARFYRVVKQ
ncbi:MAG: hypothetical protein NT154_41005 [Verrucomicrobia bacterium]|nr:hypothetical protein [Verrucomicrobiota bacterium]